uniref:Uncharacterized protein n=1 Tax=Rhizophagus irregularis (strain DAOM 181602 / DAOM 197198 / MUCL 43194) TaxID=747089 RepID=U9U737_RHIID
MYTFQLLQILFTSFQQHHEIQNSNCPKDFLNQQRSVYLDKTLLKKEWFLSKMSLLKVT